MSAPPRRAPLPPPDPSRGPGRPRRAPGVAHVVGAVVLALLTAVFVVPDLLGLDRASPMAQLVAFRPWVLVGGLALVAMTALGTLVNRRTWPYPVAVAAVVLLGAGMVAPRLVPEPVPTGDRTLEVVAFNTFEGRADPEAVADLIAAEQPDLVSLSEAGERFASRLAPLVEPLGYRLHTSTGPRQRDVVGMTAVVSDRVGEVDVRYGEGLPFPYVEVTGGELGALRFVAYHAVAPMPGDVPQWRADLTRLQGWCAGATPAVVAGDLNATLDHSVLREGSAGCGNAAAQRGAGLVSTWGPTPRTIALGPQIDHVLATDGIVAADFSTHDIPGSDHRAVRTTLVLPDS